MLKKENETLATKIDNLKKELMDCDLIEKKQASEKADMEYGMRSQDYNVEILKN
jgi:hypothetical protein